MTLLYCFKHRWFPDGKNPIQGVYLRPAEAADVNGGRMVGDIIEVDVCALDYYFDLPEKDNPFANEQGYDIYYTRLGENDYYIRDDEDLSRNNYLMARAEIYLKAKNFDEVEFWKWIQAHFILKGYPWEELEKATLAEFPETNAILNLFSLENVKKMEAKLGKDWWKDSDET
ncbi:MAG: hypothetical protein SH848_04130 [Saprospiraceae bacterium]|nr:hypothetical protein [Saprospiraceae bacterium]MDZ4703090.1 hypothetical protein [Saprospiraceae bacterium]